MNIQRALAQYLEDNEVGSFAAEEGWGIYIDEEPEAESGPAQCVTIYMTDANNLRTLNDLGDIEAFLQVRVRSLPAEGKTAKEAGHEKSESIENLIGKKNFLVCGDRYFTSISAYSVIVPLGFDKKGRAIHVQNFKAIVKRGTI